MIPKSTIITHPVMPNGGDATMILALKNALEQAGLNPQVASTLHTEMRGLFPDEPIVSPGLFIPLSQKIPPLHQKLVELQALSRHHRNAEFVVAAPGGYFNDYYGCVGVAKKLERLAKAGKRVGVYAQSFGPLSGENAEAVVSMSQHVAVLMVREQASYDVLTKQLGIDPNKVLRSNDAAFLIESNFSPNQPSQGKVGISVRSWKHDAQNQGKYMALMVNLAKALVKNGKRVVFISTCQGIPGYHDDSKLAQEIQKQLRTESIDVEVDGDFHTTKAFMNKAVEFDAFIGTRMHACIMNLLVGTPTLNIAYEQKSRELYGELGLAEWVIEYNEPLDGADQKLKRFLEQIPNIKAQLHPTISREHVRAQEGLRSFLKMMGT